MYKNNPNADDLIYTLTHAEIGNLLADLRDIRNVLPFNALAMFKDNEGSEFTVQECLDDQINFLSSITPYSR